MVKSIRQHIVLNSRKNNNKKNLRVLQPYQIPQNLSLKFKSHSLIHTIKNRLPSKTKSIYILLSIFLYLYIIPSKFATWQCSPYYILSVGSIRNRLKSSICFPLSLLEQKLNVSFICLNRTNHC